MTDQCEYVGGPRDGQPVEGYHPLFMGFRLQCGNGYYEIALFKGKAVGIWHQQRIESGESGDTEPYDPTEGEEWKL
jgi:hypothetical protein